LDDWEKEWGKNSQRNVQPRLLPVDFPSASVAPRDDEAESPLLAIAQSN
jgi:hypothetical protein